MTLHSLRLPSLLLTICALLASVASAKESYDATEEFKQTYPISAKGTFVLANMNGNIEIVAWDRNEIAVEAEKAAKTEEDLKRIEIIVDADADKVSIKTKHHKREDDSWLGRNRDTNGRVTYRVKVPANLASVKVDGMNSNITVNGFKGDVKLNSMNGRIEASGLTANANLDTMNGAISAAFDRVAAGQKISLNSMNGSCTVRLPSDASARIDASTMNGRASSDLPMTVERSTRRSLRGKIGTGEAEVELDSMNGALKILSRS